MGGVAIGSHADAVYNEFRGHAQLVDLALEGHLSPALALRLSGSQVAPSLVAEIQPADSRLVVSRIRVLDPTVRTKQGIGVGSTYGELRGVYRVDWVGSGEGGFFARVEELAISFELDMSAQPPPWTIRDPVKVPAGVRIVQMMLTR